MSAKRRIERYLDKATLRMKRDGYDVDYDEQYLGGTFNAVAIREQLVGQYRQTFVFVFGEFGRLTSRLLEEFIDGACDFALENRKPSMEPYGWTDELLILPVAMADKATDNAVDYVENVGVPSPAHRCNVMVVVFDADLDETYFFNRPDRDAMAEAEQYVLLGE
jgi:hypothetical protein